MLIEVKVPQLSESVSEASLVTWHKKEGEAVKRDENLVDIETDKVVLETPAPADGVLVRIIKKDGEAVTSGEVIAEIDTEAQAAATTNAASAEPAAAPAAAPAPSAPAAEPAAAAPAAAAPAAAGVASPAARKILEEKGLSATDVTGTGRGGRVTKEDALQAAPKAAAAAPVAAPVAAMPAGERPEQRVPMTKIRKRIAERLLQSKQETAMLTTFNEVNMLPVIELRKKYGEQFEKEYGVRLGFMSFFVKAACAALKKFPILNASVDGDDIIYHGYIDIGIAVGSPRGLVVPILRDADQMSFAEIEKKIAEFGQRAKDGRLTVEELTGGTFSISNGGVFGSMLSTPIINPPQSAILGIHGSPGGRERPDRDSPDQLLGAFVRPPHHRRARSRTRAQNHQRDAGRSSTPPSQPLKASGANTKTGSEQQ
jgi:2-oxoglutarate dehydrogenase E2 component (dihydrolipoamide succinyltransferase)